MFNRIEPKIDIQMNNRKTNAKKLIVAYHSKMKQSIEFYDDGIDLHVLLKSSGKVV